MDKSFIVFPMAMIILMGEIVISVAATVALSSVIHGRQLQCGKGRADGGGHLAGACPGTICGMING
jgi:rhamnose transport system permease protein